MTPLATPVPGNVSTYSCNQLQLMESAEMSDTNLFHSTSDPSNFLICGASAFSTKVRNKLINFFSIFIANTYYYSFVAAQQKHQLIYPPNQMNPAFALFINSLFRWWVFLRMINFIDFCLLPLFPYRILHYFLAITSMLPRNAYGQPQAKRKSKEGDWVCVRCGNYNYAFRNNCNRCRVQSKNENEYAVSMIAHNNYGENFFPSALFITLDPLKVKENREAEKVTKIQDELVLRQNNWIDNLISE